MGKHAASVLALFLLIVTPGLGRQTAHYPVGAERRPAVIVLPGSQGGIPGPGSPAGGLASRGYIVLALAYFNAEGLPALVQNIPLEYFATGMQRRFPQQDLALSGRDRFLKRMADSGAMARATIPLERPMHLC